MTEEELEKRIEQVYRRAAEETSQKLDDYMKQFERLEEEKKATLSEEDFKKWRAGKIANGERWKSLTNSLARDVLNCDNKARDMINGYLPEAFSDGYNYSCYEMALNMGDSYVNGTFSLYNKEAVTRLVRDNPDLLPQLNPNSKTAEDIRAGKIIQWNKQKINSEVTQGILQGESIGKIASRMKTVVGMEKNAAIRNARTATNGARNAGKEESYEDAEELGIEVMQVWVASIDDRTRYEHRQLDGQMVKVGEKFKVDEFEIAYPCDPTADASMVYNCRCTIVPHLPKFNKGKPDMHPSVSEEKYEEWKKNQPYHTEKEPEETTTYEVATNREEAVQLLRDTGFSRIRGVDDVSDRLLIENSNRLAELNERFGAIDNLVLTIRPIEDNDAIAYVKGTTKSLTMNSNYYYNTRVLRNEVDRQMQTNDEGRFHSMPVAKEYYDTCILTHEYGHMVQTTIWENMGYQKIVDGKLTPEFRQWTVDVMNEVYGIAKDLNPDLVWNEQVGTYAEVNTSEFFAECFMNAFCGAPNDLGNAMEIWLERQGY